MKAKGRGKRDVRLFIPHHNHTPHISKSRVCRHLSIYSLLPPIVSSVQFSRSVVSVSLQPHGLQHARLPCPSPTPGACSHSCLSSQWCHPTVSFSVVPFSSCLQSCPASGYFPVSQFFASGGQVLELQLQHQSFQWIFRTDFLLDWLVGSPCSPRNSQESSPTPQFKSINSSMFSHLYSPTFTSIHDYWENHRFD